MLISPLCECWQATNPESTQHRVSTDVHLSGLLGQCGKYAFELLLLGVNLYKMEKDGTGKMRNRTLLKRELHQAGILCKNCILAALKSQLLERLKNKTWKMCRIKDC